MNKYLALVLMSFLLFSCIKNSNAKNSLEITETKIDKLISDKQDNIQPEFEPDTILLPLVYEEGIRINIPGGYRNETPEQYNYLLKDGWLEVYQDTVTKAFHIIKSKAVVEWGYDDCIQDSITSISTENPFEPIVFISGLEQKTNKKLKSIPIKQPRIWPKHKETFTFNNQEYTLESDGYVLSSEPCYYNDGVLDKIEDVINYRLYLKTQINGVTLKQLLIAIPKTNDTFTTILFIGDIDNDGKPDFIFDVSRDYEEKCIVLFLSGKAKKDEIVRCVGEASYQFDC